jgi:hypothetical protein
MNLQDLIGQMGGIQSVAREIGVSETQATSGAAALLPAILGGFKKQAQAQATGLDDLSGLLGKLGGGGLLEDVLGPAPTNVGRGNEVLGHIFGSKDVSRAVAANAATQTGLDAGALKKMLPMLAMVVGGYMSKHSSGHPAAPAPGGGGLGGLVGGLLGGSHARGGETGLASMLDMDGDGNALDDIVRLAGKALR